MGSFIKSKYSTSIGCGLPLWLTSLTAVVSATQENVMSHDWTTSAGLFPLNAPDLTKSLH